MKRNLLFGRTWEEIEKLRRAHGLPERVELALMDATFNYKVRNARYREDNEISDVVASRDLKELSELGLLIPVGEKRGRHYLAGKPLKKIREKLADNSRAPNPYDIVRGEEGTSQLSLAV
jgi:hypothetical protein